MKLPGRWLLLAFAVLTAINAGMLVTSRIYPFVDLPNHLATATIYRHIGGADNRFAEFFTIGPLFPNANVAYLLFAGWDLFPSVEFANRTFYILYGLLVPLGLWLLIREVDGDPWYALLGFLLLYNLNCVFGFVGFTASAPVVLFVMWTALRGFRGGWGWTAASGALLVALFCCHALAFLFGLGTYLLGCLRGRRNWPRAIAAAPAFAVFVAWWIRRPVEESTFAYMAGYYTKHFLENLPRRATFPLMDFYQILPGALGPLLAMVVAAAILVPLIAHRKRLFAGAAAHPLASMFLFALACCSLLPPEIPREPVLNQRFSVFLYLAAIVLLSRLPSSAGARVAIIGGCLLFGGLRWNYFREFNRENAAFDPAFLPAKESRMAGMVQESTFWGWPLYVHFPNYHIVWNKGIAGTSAVDYRFGVVRRKAGFDRLPYHREWIGMEGGYQGEYHGVEYILVRGRPPERWLGPWPTGPGFDESRRAGEWRLMRNRGLSHGTIEGVSSGNGRVAQLAEQLTLNQ